MEKITVIIGEADSGKTMKAKEIASSYKKENVTWMNGKNWKHDRPFLYRSCSLNTELIIIDDCDDASHIEIICSRGVKVEKPYEEPFYIDPKIIIVCSSEISIDDFIQSNAFKRRVTIINCNDVDMIPKLKAKELVDKFSNVPLLDSYEAKQCALVAVDEIINSNPHSNPLNTDVHSTMSYWNEVKHEIEKI